MQNYEFLDALSQIARDSNIAEDELLEALANALLAAYKRLPDSAEEAEVTIDRESGEIKVWGLELDVDGNVTREWDATPKDFGRIAAQTAKQVLMQIIRDIQRKQMYDEYAGREGDIVTGIVQQTDSRYTLLDLGKVEALLPQAEQIAYERYDHGARVKAYIVEVRKTTKGPQIVVSRTHPGLVKRLFELEVPEIASGIVEIKALAREPGHRTKIAVWSNDHNVDPVGACVGARGSRVRMVTNELKSERVDVVPYSEDPVDFIQSALQPARVREVRLDDEGNATVIVNDAQLSLAIGKEGQNARLAARLTGWRIDIRSESQDAEEADIEYAEGEWVEEDGQMVWHPAPEAAEDVVEAMAEVVAEDIAEVVVEAAIVEALAAEVAEELAEAGDNPSEELLAKAAAVEILAEEVAEELVEVIVEEAIVEELAAEVVAEELEVEAVEVAIVEELIEEAAAAEEHADQVAADELDEEEAEAAEVGAEEAAAEDATA